MKVELDQPCPTCGAPKDKPCDIMNKSTGRIKILKKPHTSRLNLARKVKEVSLGRG